MRSYDYLPVETVAFYLPMMKDRGVSIVSRESGFTKMYLSGKDPKTEKVSSRQTWHQKRHNYIKRRLGNRYYLFDTDGKPSRYHLSLISWGYSPSKKIRKGVPGE